MKLFAKQSSSGDGRVFRSGVWSAAIAAAVIVLAVLVNLIVRAIPSRYTEFDLSEAGLYTPERELQTGGRRPDAGCDHLLSGPDRQ